MAEMKEFFQKVINALETNKIDYVIVGGLAAILNGSARTTSDIDIILSPLLKSGELYGSDEYTDKIITAFRDAGFDVMENQLRLAFKENFNTSIFAPDSVIRIDLKVATNEDEKEVLHTSEEKRYHDLVFKIASIEQILYGKILYLGNISDLDDEELLDFNDVRDFVNVYHHANSVNVDWLKGKARKKGLSITLNRLLAKVKDVYKN